jgi:4-hydroxy-tetrahydrodipicolinate synthase
MGRVDVDALGHLLERLCAAEVSSIGVLGSTGIYAYLSQGERRRAISAAVESVRGRVPLIVGIGSIRTDLSEELVKEAEGLGADAVLMAPVSYTPLTDREVYEHYVSVARATGLPLCIYDNPSTTHFSFKQELLQRLSGEANIVAAKLPLPADGNVTGELTSLRQHTGLLIGYSGDWGGAGALLEGADAWYSVVAGLLPRITLELARSAQAGDRNGATERDLRFQPLWDAFKAFGSLRVMYALHDLVAPGRATPPRPLLPLVGDELQRVIEAAEPLMAREFADLPR